MGEKPTQARFREGVPSGPAFESVRVVGGIEMASQAPAPLFSAEQHALFDTVGCVRCHVPSLEGADGQPVALFSDLLLHRIMPDDFRGMSEPGAPVGFYRTAPLWGNRDTAPYLHDGRAETVDEAIRSHFGEADFARLNYLALSDPEREALLHFVADI